MQFNVTLPIDLITPPGEFLSLEGITELAQATERAGYTAACVTDHPCPTGRWLDSGGHYAQDPFVVLSVIATVTRKLRLQTGIIVLPYRNPFILARTIATLDHLSGGRVTLGMAVGYLKGEYRALGVDFEKRNELMDEYLLALKAALSGEEFKFKGTGYEAYGNRIQPGPVQKPHPPFLIGGNSKRALRRAAELGDAWNPFFTAGDVQTASARTVQLTGEADVATSIAYMKEHCEKIGREKPPEVILGGLHTPGETWSTQQYLDIIGRYRDMGVSGVGLGVSGRTRKEWCDNAARMGAEVIAKVSPA